MTVAQGAPHKMNQLYGKAVANRPDDSWQGKTMINETYPVGDNEAPA